jgi:hypothetical protein
MVLESAMSQPASATSIATLYLQDLARSSARMLFRRLRTRDQVTAEYDAGTWHQRLHDRAWLRAADLSAFLVGNDRNLRIAKVGGRIVEIRTDEYYRLRLRALADLIAERAPADDEDDEIVELGCGAGYNLFSLAAAGRFGRFAGFDISENAIAAATATAAHFGLTDRFRFGLIDLTKANHPGFNEIAGKTVFTYFAIEQVPRAVEDVLENIRRQRPRRVIHMEPSTELLKPWKPLDLLNYVYVKSMDYQTRLFTAVEELAAAGQARIVARRRLPWAPTIHNDGVMVTWEPA